jgi:hypothetical protein
MREEYALSTVLNLGRQVHQIDVREQGRTERTSCYILDTKNVAIIETGAAPGIVYLLDALKSLEIAVQRVKYIIVTHIHLDHSGGAGQLARELPESQIIVHPRAFKAMATKRAPQNPGFIKTTRLIAASWINPQRIIMPKVILFGQIITTHHSLTNFRNICIIFAYFNASFILQNRTKLLQFFNKQQQRHAVQFYRHDFCWYLLSKELNVVLRLLKEV